MLPDNLSQALLRNFTTYANLKFSKLLGYQVPNPVSGYMLVL